MRSWTRIQKATVLFTLVYAVVFLYVLIFKPFPKELYVSFNNIYQILPPLFAGICGLLCYRRGFHINPIRRIGWFMISLACLSFAAGQCTWTYYETLLHVETPFPSWADAGYLGAYPLLIAGVLMLFGSMPVAGRARQLLDNFIAASSVGFLSWYFIVQRIWHQSGVSLLGKCISISYPLGDIAALFGAVVLLSSAGSNRLLRRSLYFLATGILLIAFFDTSFTWMSFNGTYQTGSWSDWTVAFGYLMIAYAFLSRIWWISEEERSATSIEDPWAMTLQGLQQIAVPYLAVTVASSVVGIYDYAQDGKVGYSTLTAGVFLLSLVVFRQVLTLVENRTLTVKLKAFSDNLEKLVAQRTEQLSALHNLTKAVNTTMRPDEVLATAVAQTRDALCANAIIVWLTDNSYDEKKKPSVKLHEGFEEQPDMFAFLAEQPMRKVVDLISLVTSPESDNTAQGSCLRAPLRSQQGVTGMIGVVRWNGDFGATEGQLLESIGLEVGTALENARLYSAAVEAADIDSVTGLLNHRAIHQRMDRALQQAAKQEQPLSIIMMDMDNFKLFNDTYGHPVGDQVLKQVGTSLRKVCRQRDILARYGGDEFIAVLPGTDSETALQIAQRLRESMDLAGFQQANEERVVPVTLSFGISTFPLDSTNRHELLTIADSNLYAAKQSDERIAATTETQRSNRRLRGQDSFGILDALITAVDNKDRYTRRHSETVTEYALWIAEEMGLSEETQKHVRIGGLLHDIGKIGVPDEILRKPSRLTPEEYEILQRHSWLGALIVGSIPRMEGAVDAVRHHHERWDGQGYSGQLSHEQIPLLGRIMAVADAFSAMTTDRSYRRALSWETALEEILANRNTQFDPAVVDAFLRVAQQRRPFKLHDHDGAEQRDAA